MIQKDRLAITISFWICMALLGPYIFRQLTQIHSVDINISLGIYVLVLGIILYKKLKA